MAKITISCKSCIGSYQQYKLEDLSLCVYHTGMSCGVKLIDGIEKFFNYYNIENDFKGIQQDFLQMLKSVLQNSPGAFYIISYRDNGSFGDLRDDVEKFINQLFKPIDEEHNPNSGNTINMKIATATDLNQAIIKLEKELGPSQAIDVTKVWEH